MKYLLLLFPLLAQAQEICPPYERTLPNNWVEYNDTEDTWQCHKLSDNVTECKDKDSSWLNIDINERSIQVYQDNTWKETSKDCDE